MLFSSNTPDRLTVSAKARSLAEQIDENDFLCLGKTTISRSELYSFMMALGYYAKKQEKLVNPYSGGFILDKSIDGRTQAIICCQYLSELSEDDIDNITNKTNVYTMAEQVANAGFTIMSDYIKRTEEDISLELLMELDDQYNELE